MTERADTFEYAFKIVRHTDLHDGFLPLKIVQLRHRQFAGGWSSELTREYLDRGVAVAVLPYDPVRDQVVLVEQFRIGALHAADHPWTLEIVAGLAESDEDSLDVARRELHEEAGCTLQRAEFIYECLPTPGYSTERVLLYCGQIDAREAGHLQGLAEEHEDIRVHVVSREQALAMLDNGTIKAAPAIIALQWLALNVHTLRQRWG